MIWLSSMAQSVLTELGAVGKLLDEVGDESGVEPAADEGVAADGPDVEPAADEGVAADVPDVDNAAEGAVPIAAREGVGAEVSDGVVIAGGLSRRSSNSGVGQSWQAVSVHPMIAMAFFLSFFLRDLLLWMLL